MFNNNGGQGYQVEDYFKSEAYLRGLKNDLLDQESRLQRQGNNLADWQRAYRTLEHALGQWQQAHAQQAQQIAMLEDKYARYVSASKEAIGEWKEHHQRLKEDNAKLNARVIDQQKAIDQLQIERLNHAPTAIKNDAQDTITELRQMNTQLQAQFSALETDMRLLDPTEREQRLTDLLKQNARLAGKVIDAAHEIQADMTNSGRSLADLQSLHDVVEAQGLHLEDDLRLQS